MLDHTSTIPTVEIVIHDTDRTCIKEDKTMLDTVTQNTIQTVAVRGAYVSNDSTSPAVSFPHKISTTTTLIARRTDTDDIVSCAGSVVNCDSTWQLMVPGKQQRETAMAVLDGRATTNCLCLNFALLQIPQLVALLAATPPLQGTQSTCR
jgi:hypothetical protein